MTATQLPPDAEFPQPRLPEPEEVPPEQKLLWQAVVATGLILASVTLNSAIAYLLLNTIAEADASLRVCLAVGIATMLFLASVRAGQRIS